MSSSVVSDDNISLKCTDDERKVNFLNPVLVNPWHSVMPMGYSETFNESLLNLTKQKKQIKYSRPRKPSKRDRCVVRLNRLHPEITKSKIRAALTLCDGDPVESVRLLNVCIKKMHLKVLSCPSCNPSAQAEDDDANEDNIDVCASNDVYLQADINQNSITIYNSPLGQDKKIPPLGSFPFNAGTAAVSKIYEISTSPSDRLSTVTATESTDTEVDVCQLSGSEESDYYSYKKIAWTPSEKIGIVLKRTHSGKYTATLM